MSHLGAHRPRIVPESRQVRDVQFSAGNLRPRGPMKTTNNPVAAASRVSKPSGIKTVAAWTDAKLSVGAAKIYYEVSRPTSGKVKGSVVLLHELRTDHRDGAPIRDAL